MFRIWRGHRLAMLRQMSRSEPFPSALYLPGIPALPGFCISIQTVRCTSSFLSLYIYRLPGISVQLRPWKSTYWQIHKWLCICSDCQVDQFIYDCQLRLPNKMLRLPILSWLCKTIGCQENQLIVCTVYLEIAGIPLAP
jgi:hypothetical protein